ncbi:Isopentenyl phosphate kinase [gamma proteobacterium IMCC2047]|nr:Isopentenyl phosphate kinase [gamma proteobacterium IMCC2047]
MREHTDGREFRPWLLLTVTLAISAALAAICYGLQVYFIGPT